jgi:hypothetical protein
VNVKQRHHVEAQVIGCKLERSSNVSSRRRKIGVCQRNDLRTRGCSRCVKHQCDVIRIGKSTRSASVAVEPVERE